MKVSLYSVLISPVKMMTIMKMFMNYSRSWIILMDLGKWMCSMYVYGRKIGLYTLINVLMENVIWRK